MRSLTPSLTRRLTVAIALAALVLGACGGDDDTGSADTASSDTGSGDATSSASADSDSITILDFAFDPESVTVAAGSEVTFANEDSTAHTATADDDSFASGSIAGNSSGTVTAPDAAGEYPYFCSIHPSMTATLIVE